MTRLDVGQLRLHYESLAGVSAGLLEMRASVEITNAVQYIAAGMAEIAEAIAETEAEHTIELDAQAVGLLAKALLHLRISGGGGALHDEIRGFLRGFGYPEPSTAEKEAKRV